MSVTSQSSDLTFAVPARPEAVAAARRKLQKGGLDQDLEHTVSLLTSEVVSNVLRHAGLAPDDRILVAARLHADWARVEVRDGGPGFDPDVRHQTRGYGLRLVDMLSSDWGVDRDERGTRVWFEVDRRTRRFARDGA